tara:strand:- start:190 stop:435 length:246 start_codon:yes stop_codon:yes gene_type:complete
MSDLSEEIATDQLLVRLMHLYVIWAKEKGEEVGFVLPKRDKAIAKLAEKLIRSGALILDIVDDGSQRTDVDAGYARLRRGQ